MYLTSTTSRTNGVITISILLYLFVMNWYDKGGGGGGGGGKHREIALRMIILLEVEGSSSS